MSTKPVSSSLFSMSSLPLTTVLPALGLSLAYLNARWRLTVDLQAISSLAKACRSTASAESRDRLNLFYVLEGHALDRTAAGRPFLVYGGRTYTFHQVYVLALRYGAFFAKEYDLQAGDIVAVDFMNSDSLVFIVLGLFSIGAVPAFINYNLSKAPLHHCIKTSGARVLLVEQEVYEAKFSCSGQGSATKASSAPRCDDKGPVRTVIYDRALETRIMSTEPVRARDSCRAQHSGSNIAMLIYTSGTTGLPKPAVVSWRKCHRAGHGAKNCLKMGPSDRFYTCMPLYHSTATVLGFLPCLFAGSTFVLGRKFSARNFWAEVRATDSTLVQYVGETMRYLLATPPAIDPTTGEDLDKKHRVRAIFGNGLRPDIWNKVKERFGIETVTEFFASTESSGAITNCSRNDFSAGAVGSFGTVGKFIMGRASAIVHVDVLTEEPWRNPKSGFCKRVPDGETGELIWRLNEKDVHHDFQGYFGNDKATERKIMRDVFKKGDAWFRTGDVVRCDSEGRYYFSDRLGDTFRWRSENVSTSEVAEIMGQHPEIHEANVYGVKIPHHEGRAGCAAIVLRGQVESTNTEAQDVKGKEQKQKKPGLQDQNGLIPIHRPTPQVLASIATHAFSNLPRYAVPVFLRVVREIKGTGNNKQSKVALRNDGVDLESLEARGVDDIWYHLHGQVYVPFGREQWRALKAGQVKL